MSRTPDPSFAGRAGSGIPAPPSGFLDAASGQPMHPAARAALDAALDTGWADPARLYGAARRARMLLDGARESVAAALECRTDEVSFTASATQAIHLGVAGTLLGRARTGRDLVTSAVEHSAVLHAAESHERGGGTRTAVRVDRHGRVDAEEFVSAINETTALACLQSANHEVGTVQPTEAVGAACANLGVPLLVDAAQSIAHGPVMGWSLLAASA